MQTIRCAHPALSNPLQDLATRPARKSKSDETPGISTGGSVVPPATSPKVSRAAITGVPLIVKTSDNGAKVLDAGWGMKRFIHREDIGTTIYSVLGVDGRKTISSPLRPRLWAPARLPSPGYGPYF